MKRFYYIIAAILTLGCVSCEKSESLNSPIEFKISTEGVTTKAKRYNNATQFGAVSGQEFGIYAWDNNGTLIYDNASVTKTSGTTWKASGATKYWGRNASYTFEAVYPRITGTPTEGLLAFTSNTLTGGVAFSYKVPAATTSANAKDVMVAYYQGTGTEGELARFATLTFTHPLTCVNFAAGTMTGVASITSISLSGVYSQGACTVRATTDGSNRQCYSYEQNNSTHTTLWNTSLATSITVTGTSTVTPANLNANVEAYNFLLIPQTVSTTAPVTLTVNLTTTTGDSKTATINIPAIYWRAGYYYTYAINYSGYALSLTPVKVTPWNEENPVAITLN